MVEGCTAGPVRGSDESAEASKYCIDATDPRANLEFLDRMSVIFTFEDVDDELINAS
jgi:hypothetical protein